MPRVIMICESNPGVMELWSGGFSMLQHSISPRLVSQIMMTRRNTRRFARRMP